MNTHASEYLNKLEQAQKQLSDALAANELLIAENRRLRHALDLIAKSQRGYSHEYCTGIANAALNKHGSQS